MVIEAAGEADSREVEAADEVVMAADTEANNKVATVGNQAMVNNRVVTADSNNNKVMVSHKVGSEVNLNKVDSKVDEVDTITFSNNPNKADTNSNHKAGSAASTKIYIFKIIL